MEESTAYLQECFYKFDELADVVSSYMTCVDTVIPTNKTVIKSQVMKELRSVLK